jgi:CubicO group peptidase (beta-lactamase class C family)
MPLFPMPFFPMALFLALILSACSGPSPENTVALAEPKVDPAYAPPRFRQEDRSHRMADALAKAHQYYQDCAKQNHIPGLVYGLVVDDSLVFSGGFGTINRDSQEPVTAHSLFRMASMTKSFTAMAILKLRDEGKLSLTDPAALYIPAMEDLKYPTSDAPPVTLFQLLTMTAGFPEDNPWGDRFLDISPEDLLSHIDAGIPFSTVPSLQYEYSNLGYGILGLVISRVSGQPFQEYISEQILEPLGMTHTTWEYTEVPDKLLALGYRRDHQQWIREPMLHDGAFGSMGGLITSIEDFSRYVSLHLDAWPPRSEAETGPVKRSTLREMHRMNHPRLSAGTGPSGERHPSMVLGYGLGLRVSEDENGVVEVGHNGGLPGFGSSYMFYPHQGIGIMAFGNLTYVGSKLKSANYQVIEILREQGLFEARSPALSPILARRKEEVAQLLLHWEPQLEQEIVAANLYQDIPREVRMAEARGLLERAGDLRAVGPVDPENQLRGSFLMEGNHGWVRVHFTLSPEAVPKVQWISMEFIPSEP